MENKKLNAKVRVYSVKDKDFLLYKFKGNYYPLPLVQEAEGELEKHTAPSAYKAAMVAQKQYAPLYSRQMKSLNMKKSDFKLEEIFTM